MALKIRETTPSPAATYESDFFRWTQEQSRALLEHRQAEIDWTNVAEEIRSLGNTDTNEISSRLTILLIHLLKWKFQPKARSSSWRGTIIEQRRRLQRVLRQSPSLRHYPAEILDEDYEVARLKAAGETLLSEDVFPDKCPYTVDQILDDDFLPEPDDLS